MITEYEHEPIRGLPGHLPPGERILWQGAPEWRSFAASALHARWLGFYFVLLFALAVVGGNLFGMAATLVGAAVLTLLMTVFATLVARTTVYTITNRRVVLRIGVALNGCVNVPLKLIESADLRPLGGGHGDIALKLEGRLRLSYALLWPHARPWRIGNPQPMLRAVPASAEVAETLASACTAVSNIERAAATVGQVNAPVTPLPAFREAAA
jgi:hypothetical protein